MFAGIWDSETLDNEICSFPWYEFIQKLDGEVAITKEDGTTHIFKAGDAFFYQKERFAGGKSMGMERNFMPFWTRLRINSAILIG